MKLYIGYFAFIFTGTSIQAQPQAAYQLTMQAYELNRNLRLGCTLRTHLLQQVKIRADYETIIDIPVKVGDRVRKGDAIAMASTERLNTGYEELQRKLNEFNSKLVKSQEETSFLEKEVERSRRLVEEGSLSEAQLQAHIATYENAKTALLKQKIESANIEDQLAAAKAKFTLATYKAEIDGVVTILLAPTYRPLVPFTLAAEQNLALIASLGSYDMECAATDQQILALTPDKEGKVRISGEHIERSCKVLSIARNAKVKNDKLKLYEVICHFEESTKVFPQGIAGEVSFPLWHERVENALPWEAIYFENKKAWVKVLDKNTNSTKPREVVLGRRGERAVEITAGLTTSDTVVISP